MQDASTSSPAIPAGSAIPTAVKKEGGGIDADSKHDVVDDDENVIIVFQCVSCRAIIADSTLPYENDPDCETIAFAGAMSIAQLPEIHLSKAGADAGCTYRKVTCAICHSFLGRVYTSTTAELDHRRETFIVDSSAISTYRLGDARTPAGESLPRPPAAVAPSPPQTSTAPAAAAAAPAAPAPAPPVATLAHADKVALQKELFELDAHVNTVTQAVNKLTDAFKATRSTVHELRANMREVRAHMHDQRASFAELRKQCSNSQQAVTDGERTLAHVQGLLMVWEGRINKLDDFDRRLVDLDHKVFELVEPHPPPHPPPPPRRTPQQLWKGRPEAVREGSEAVAAGATCVAGVKRERDDDGDGQVATERGSLGPQSKRSAVEAPPTGEKPRRSWRTRDSN